MPAHQRRFHENSSKSTGGKQTVFSHINEDIKALNSSILIISQKIKFLVRNEKILGRNILVLNKKIKSLQDYRVLGKGSSTGSSEGVEELTKAVSELTDKVSALESEVENIRQTYAKSEQVSEMKYVVDSINPLEFATLKDLAEATGTKPKSKKKK